MDQYNKTIFLEKFAKARALDLEAISLFFSDTTRQHLQVIQKEIYAIVGEQLLKTTDAKEKKETENTIKKVHID